MHFIRQYPTFALLMGAALLAIVVLGAGIIELAVGNHRAKAKLKKRQHELRTLAASELLLSEAEAKLSAEKISELEQRNLERLARNSVSPNETVTAGTAAPTTATDAFFDLAAFVERMAAQGRSCGVKLAVDERFGFSTYAKSGPEQELIPAVLKQRELVERVLKYLFAARPDRLLSVARERPPRSSGSQMNTIAAANADLFAFSPLNSLQVDGEISTMALRIVFVGDTAVLRSFLNAMTEGDPRLLLRSVEAEALGDEASRRGNVNQPERPQTALISHRTKFTVVVEAFEFLRSPLLEGVSS